MSTTIELPSFSGPLDLLLHLIERAELDITAISLARVASQFLQEVEKLKAQEERIGQLIEFIVIGAQLALIKSRALLPKNPILIEGEEQEDPAEALARRLREYKQFKESAGWLRAREEAGLRTYLRLEPPPRPKMESELDLTGISVETLQNALLLALERGDRLEDSVMVAQKPTITIEGQIGRLRRAIATYGRFPFKNLLSNKPNRAELSVTLLAVLELIKRHEIRAYQEFMFGPIDIGAFDPLPANDGGQSQHAP